MSDQTSDRMDALTEAIVRLLKRQDETEQRLSQIEASLGIARRVEVRPAPIPQAPPPRVEPVPQPAAPTPAVAPPLKPELETRVGLSWINRIGAFTLILAVAFFFKYAVDNNWIGETGRVLLGVLAGVIALAGADILWKRGHQTYAHGICGAGIAILYLSYYAAFGLYQLVGPALAFVLLVSATAMAGALALRYDSLAIACLGLIGGYATPVLLSSGADRPWVFLTYLLLLNAGGLALARARDWKRLEMLCFTGTAFLYGGWFADRFNSEKRLVATLFGYAFYAMFATSGMRLIVVASQIAAGIVLPIIWSRSIIMYPLASLALAAAGLALAHHRGWKLLGSAAFGMFWLSYAAWVTDWSYANRPIGGVLLFLTAGFGLFFAWLPWRVLVKRLAPVNVDFLILGMNAAFYFGAAYDLLNTDYNAWLGLLAVAVAAPHLALGTALWRNIPQDNRDPRPVLFALGIALTLLTLAAPIQFTGYRITMAWAVEAAILAWIAQRAQSPRLTWASLFVFALVILRLETIDSWAPGADATFLNVRLLTFLISAAALWAAAYWNRTGIPALATYVAGHFVMLWSLGLEIVAWARRTWSAENVRSVETVSISILIALYAVLLVGAGAITRTVINRFLGLGLIALVVLKLYLYDVWSMVRIHRVVAFGALGALLLLTSFLYSRYREPIESWWKDEKSGNA